MKISDIDWPRWAPTDVATLLFILRKGRVLLIRKKRGLGAGKINAPGGRLEAGETLAACAVREVTEETGITPVAPRARGGLRFQFVDGYALECHVFSADGYTGELRETDEALPLWFPLEEIPYGEMWTDDGLWLPKMLSGYGFRGLFVFDNDTLLDHALDLDDPADALFARLRELGISTVTDVHPPVFTVAYSKKLALARQGTAIKNLFLRNKQGVQWLVTVREDRDVDIKAFGKRTGAGHLSFGSPERLRKSLGVEPGSVTPFAAMNDREGLVRVILDAAILTDDPVLAHPLANDRTTAISAQDLVRFLTATGHPPLVLDFDALTP